MSVEASTNVEIPEILRSERLTLRAPHPDFAAEMNAAIAESIDELRPWMDWAQDVPTLAESRAQQERAREAFLAREDLQLILFRGERIIGSSGLHRIDWTIPKFESGYWVRSSEQRRGYITEAVAAIADFAFDTLAARRLEIRASPTNTRSLAVPERLGFTLEGVLRNDALNTDGSLRDTAVYAKVR
jgi:RimJ/RimL family protein N-acetyltransferase